MAGAVIGALRVDLGLNSAQFQTGMKNAEAQMNRFGRISKVNAFVLRDLSFQLNDVVTGLVTGQRPMQVLAQQGGQIVGAFQMAEGGAAGVMASFGAILAPMAPVIIGVAVAAAALATAVAGITHKINENSKVQVGWKDVVVASWQLVAENMTKSVGPAINQLGVWFGQFVDWITPAFKNVGNFIIGTFVAAYDETIIYWNQLPAALGDVFVSAVQNVSDRIKQMVNMTIDGINFMREKIGWDKLGSWGGWQVSNPFAGAYQSMQSAIGQANQRAWSTDYMGQAFDAISQRSQKLVLAAKGAGEAVKGAGGAAKAANDNFKALAGDGLQAANDNMSQFQSVFSGFFSDIAHGKSFIDSLTGALQKLADQALSMVTNNLFTSLFGNLFGGGMGGSFVGNGFGAYGKFASGTNFAPGGLALVGERGPEFVNLPRGSQVIPADRTAQMMGGGGGGALSVHVTVGVDKSGNIVPLIAQVSGQVAGQHIAANNRNVVPGIVSAGIRDRVIK